MSIIRHQGPLVISGAGPNPPSLDYNDSAGPSIFVHGTGLVDSRFGPFNGGDITNPLPCWYGMGEICVLDQAPSAISATNLAAAQVPVAGTAMTLANASTGITVLAAPYYLSTNTFPTGARVIDGNPALLSIAALGGGVSPYDPRTMASRTIQFTSVGDDHLGTVAILSMDQFGFLVHETVTLTNASVATSVKCHKAVISLTPGGTLSGANLSAGAADSYEFGLAAFEFQFVKIYWNSALISASTGFTAAVTTSPATATTGNVRGTYAVQSASDGTKKLQVFVKPVAWHMDTSGLFGVTNF